MDEVCAVAKRFGYHGIEIAPFALATSADEISVKERTETRRTIEDHGLAVVGLHWLFAGPGGLHMTTPDNAVWEHTVDYMNTLVELCADLGGDVLVLGSPKQRSLIDGQTQEGAWGRTLDFFARVLDTAAAHNVTICLEPLAPIETDFINTVADGMRMVKEVGHPNLKIHLDVKAMCAEPTSIGEVIRSVRTEEVGHFHVNDANLYGPGMGDTDYAPIAAAVREIGWDSWLSVEVFKYDPDPETIARKSIAHLREHFG